MPRSVPKAAWLDRSVPKVGGTLVWVFATVNRQRHVSFACPRSTPCPCEAQADGGDLGDLGVCLQLPAVVLKAHRSYLRRQNLYFSNLCVHVCAHCVRGVMVCAFVCAKCNWFGFCAASAGRCAGMAWRVGWRAFILCQLPSERRTPACPFSCAVCTCTIPPLSDAPFVSPHTFHPFLAPSCYVCSLRPPAAVLLPFARGTYPHLTMASPLDHIDVLPWNFDPLDAVPVHAELPPPLAADMDVLSICDALGPVVQDPLDVIAALPAARQQTRQGKRVRKRVLKRMGKSRGQAAAMEVEAAGPAAEQLCVRRLQEQRRRIQGLRVAVARGPVLKVRVFPLSPRLRSNSCKWQQNMIRVPCRFTQAFASWRACHNES